MVGSRGGWGVVGGKGYLPLAASWRVKKRGGRCDQQYSSKFLNGIAKKKKITPQKKKGRYQ